jgi:NAD(P)-dependent dehydrogenase (short-subunit alcohol dehydrogenase family)
MARLENRVVMITGGAQGIGEGVARRLASEGAAIAIADINGDKAIAVTETWKGEGAAGAIGVPACGEAMSNGHASGPT